MRHRHYLGGICGSEGNYGIVFPDFLGCVSSGETIDRVIAMGREGLQFHIDGMIEDGDPIPEPSAVDFARLDAAFTDEDSDALDPWVAIVAIDVQLPDYPDTINVSLDSALVRSIAEVLHTEGARLDLSTSRQFIERAARRELDRLKKSA